MENPFDLIMAKLDRVEKLLIDLVNAKKPPEPDVFITRKEAAAILHITLPTLSKRILDGKVKGYRNGRRLLFKKDEVEAAMTIVKIKK